MRYDEATAERVRRILFNTIALIEIEMFPDRLPDRVTHGSVLKRAQDRTKSLLGNGTDLMCHDDGIELLAGCTGRKPDFSRIEPSLRRGQGKNGNIRSSKVEFLVADNEHRSSPALLRTADWIKIRFDDTP